MEMLFEGQTAVEVRLPGTEQRIRVVIDPNTRHASVYGANTVDSIFCVHVIADRESGEELTVHAECLAGEDNALVQASFRRATGPWWSFPPMLRAWALKSVPTGIKQPGIHVEAGFEGTSFRELGYQPPSHEILTVTS